MTLPKKFYHHRLRTQRIYCPFLYYSYYKRNKSYYCMKARKKRVFGEMRLKFCLHYFTACPFGNKLIYLEDNEYTIGLGEWTGKPLPFKTFVNLAGIRFPIQSDGSTICPECKNRIFIASFRVRIKCPKCHTLIHGTKVF